MRTQDAQDLFDLYRNAARLSRSMVGLADRVLPDGVAMSRFELLDHLASENPSVSPLQLAEGLNLTPAAVTHLLKHLQRSGWLEITPDPDDGRAKRILLTDEGRTKHRECMIALSGLTTRKLSQLQSESVANANATLLA